MGSQSSTYSLHSTSTSINTERGVNIQFNIHGLTMLHLHATQHIHRQKEAQKRVRGTPQSYPLFRLTHSATDGFTNASKSTRNTIEETGCRLGTAFVGFTNRPCTSPARFCHPTHPVKDVLGSATFESAGDSDLVQPQDLLRFLSIHGERQKWALPCSTPLISGCSTVAGSDSSCGTGVDPSVAILGTFSENFRNVG